VDYQTIRTGRKLIQVVEVIEGEPIK